MKFVLGRGENHVGNRENTFNSIFSISHKDLETVLPQSQLNTGYWNQPVCPCVCPSVHVSVCLSVCVQNICFCQSAGGVIKSHLVTTIVFESNGQENSSETMKL